METNEKKERYTEKEVIGFTINILEGISYPAFLMEMHPRQVMTIKQAIIDPIASAKRNLYAIMEKIDMAAKEKQAGADEQEKQKALAEEERQEGKVVRMPAAEEQEEKE